MRHFEHRFILLKSTEGPLLIVVCTGNEWRGDLGE
jgi:hypothetical protein